MTERHPHRPRVFGIGLNKTGTTSLHQALTMLGFESLHWGGPPIRRLVESALDEGLPLLTHLEPRYDAFSDILALSENYALLDQQYPGSTFILTVRDVDDWIDSRARHVMRNRQRKETGEYQGEFLQIDEAGWRSEWHRHVDGVRDHFGERDDFLELDFTVATTWAPLCRVLAKPEPDGPLPWANQG